MISKNILNEAKSFLCWELYQNLTIKLISIDDAVAFFYPPATDLFTIIVFFDSKCTDFSKPLFLLFHEVGHLETYKWYEKNNTISDFWELIQLDKGPRKVNFENEAWEAGAKMLEKFIHAHQLENVDLIRKYNSFKNVCLLSYSV